MRTLPKDSVMDFLTVLSGFAVGLIVGLTGVGGGSLMTPILISFLHVPPAIAVGTDLLFAGLTKGVGSIAHNSLKQVNWRIAAFMAASSCVTASLTLWWMKHHDAQALLSPIRTGLGIALLLTAVAVLYRKKLIAWAEARAHAGMAHSRQQEILLTIGLGSLIGVLVTLSSVGAGAIGVTALLLIYPLLGMQKVVGTDLAYAVPLTLLAGSGHALLGHVDWPLLGSLLVGSVPGISIGAHLSKRAPERLLQTLLCACLSFAGFKILL
jgi:uncharacterized membrane protein YfcA